MTKSTDTLDGIPRASFFAFIAKSPAVSGKRDGCLVVDADHLMFKSRRLGIKELMHFVVGVKLSTKRTIGRICDRSNCIERDHLYIDGAALRLSQEQRRDIRRRIARGQRVADIAAIYGVQPSLVAHYRRPGEVDHRETAQKKKPHIEVSPEDEASISEALLAGEPRTRVAVGHGVGMWGVNRIAQKLKRSHQIGNTYLTMSPKQRRHALDLLDAGESVLNVAALYGVSDATIRTLRKRGE